MGQLRDRMEADLRLRNLRPNTRKAYLKCVRNFAMYHMRSPTEMGTKEVRDYLVHLRDERKLKPSTIQVHVAALKFLYSATLDRPEVVRRWLSPRVDKKLPEVLSGTEVATVLNAISSVTYRAILVTTYGAGLRIGEACRLEIADIDSKRMLINVYDGKGGKQRYAMLCQHLLDILRAYFRQVRPRGPYLFPGRKPGSHLSTSAVSRVLNRAIKRCGISKRVTPHLLRHSVATHLLETGTDIRFIQAFLGHESIQTTQIYAQVSPTQFKRINNPLQLIGSPEGQVLG